MMETLSFFKSVILGIVQGATEFLPVSSSAHLVFAQSLLGVRDEGPFLLAFDLALHFGTLLAVVVFFKEDLLNVFKSFLRKSDLPSEEKLAGHHLAKLLIIGTLPAGIVGVGLKNFFEALFDDVLWAGIFLCVTGGVLWSTRVPVRQTEPFQNLCWKRALKIGLAQAVAILPGISRSGSTISAGLWCGLKPEEAARFSFLLAIPAIFGAFVVEMGNFHFFQMKALGATLAGALAAFVVGYASIRWLLDIVGRGRFSLFAIYCWLAGAVAILSQLDF